ncbi:MBL fold metallo-hydrolase [uncultured Pseudonocardia sp.]|uniref:MBL fold metallo-hydrolase n=1 Tax=uncultured Pseudonocardia sp. TaxID=211455 RepID=UPI00345B9469
MFQQGGHRVGIGLQHGPDRLRGRWSFRATGPGFAHGDATVTLARIGHRGRTHGVRVECGGRSPAHLPDHSPATAGPRLLDNALALAAGVDLLLHDAQFTAPQRQLADSYGHATGDDALAVAGRCGAHRLVLTRHAPDRTDDELDYRARCVVDRAPDVTVAIQGRSSDCAERARRVALTSRVRGITRSVSAGVAREQTHRWHPPFPVWGTA